MLEILIAASSMVILPPPKELPNPRRPGRRGAGEPLRRRRSVRLGANRGRKPRSAALSARARQLTPQARERGIFPLGASRRFRGKQGIRIAVPVAVGVASLSVGSGAALAGSGGGVGVPQPPSL